jgi:hypothetical protein
VVGVGVTGGGVLDAVAAVFAVGVSVAVAIADELVTEGAAIAEGGTVADEIAALVDAAAVCVAFELLPLQAETTRRTERPIMSTGSGRRCERERDRLG